MNRLQAIAAHLGRRFPRLAAGRARAPSCPPRVLLDFATPQRRDRKPAIVAVAIGTILLALAQWHADTHRARLAQAEEQLAGLEQNRSAAGKKPSGRSRLQRSEIDEQVQKANAIIAQLATPWDKVFDALEGAVNRDVALLSLEPDPVRGLIRAGAEARNAHAMLDYLKRLGESGFLRQPVLISHQIKAEDPHRPIQFTFSASWSTPPSNNN